MRLGSGTPAPKTMACWRGSPEIAESSRLSNHSVASPIAFISAEPVTRKHTQVPHCVKTVGETSDGRCVLIHSDRPNFRPSFAKRS